MRGIKEFYETVKERLEIRMSLRNQPYGDWESRPDSAELVLRGPAQPLLDSGLAFS